MGTTDRDAPSSRPGEAPMSGHEPPQPEDPQVDLRALGERAEMIISYQAIHQPYRLILIAAGIGVVLGGGLPRWAVRLGLSTGARMWMNQALTALSDREAL